MNPSDAPRHGDPASIAAQIDAHILRKHWRDAESLIQSWLADSRASGDTAGLASALSYQGYLLLGRRDLHGAESAYQESIALSKSLGDSAAAAKALRGWALGLSEQQEHRKAKEVLETSLDLAEAASDSLLECEALIALAAVQRAQKRLPEAAEQLLDALHVAEKGGHEELEARALYGLAEVRSELGDSEEAVRCLADCADLRKSLGLEAPLAQVLLRLGEEEGRLARIDAALVHHDEALALARGLDDIGLGIAALTGKVTALETGGRLLEAAKASEERIDLCRTAGDAYLGCLAYEQLARIERKAKRGSEAARAIDMGLKAASAARKRQLEAKIRREAAELKHQEGDRSGAARELLKCAQLALDGGRSWEAIHAFERMAQVLNVDERDHRQIQRVEDAVTDCGLAPTPKDLLARARVLMHFGQLESALDLLDQARSCDPFLLDAWTKCSIHHVEGMIHRHAGDIGRAVELFRARVALERERNVPRDLAFGLNSLGAALVDLGDTDAAITAFAEGLAIFADHDDPSGVAIMQNGMALAHSAAGRHDVALDFLNRSLALHKGSADRGDEAVTLNIRGEVLCKLGRAKEALADLERSKALFVELQDWRGLCFALPRLGRARLALQAGAQQDDLALADLRAGIDAAEVSPDRRQIVKALLAYGEGLLEVERSKEAIVQLEHALLRAERMHDQVLTDTVRASLRCARG